MEALEFAQRMLDRGIEIIVRNKRVKVWPAAAFPHLTPEELSFIKSHRDELKALALAKTLRESTVIFAPPGIRMPEPVITCPYCGERACVGPDDRWFKVLHWRDPQEVERRNAHASAVMLRQVGR